jgi:ribonuclease III
MVLAVRHPLEALLQSGALMLFRRAANPTDLEQALGYTFKNRDLFNHALTHASVRSTKQPAGKPAKPPRGAKTPAVSQHDNERLEFLGDRVLGLAVAELLWAAYPAETEGQLAKRFNGLVRGETCAAVGRSIGIGPHLILSGSEADSGGRAKDTILADAVEALLGAMFLEAGFNKVRDIVCALWRPLLQDMPEVVTDPKSALQEWAQGRGLPLPQYVEVAREGPDHAPQFVSEVRVPGHPSARGQGPSKRIAEQAAATAMLTSAAKSSGAPLPTLATPHIGVQTKVPGSKTRTAGQTGVQPKVSND